MSKKLVVQLEITVGEGREEDYEGVLESMLEESRHYGDFDVKVKHEYIVDEGDNLDLIRFSEAAIL